MYLVFSGTEDHRKKLLEFLYGSEIEGFTGIPTFGGWRGKKLDGDMLIFFNKSDAKKAQKFLEEQCNQIEVPVIYLHHTFV
jgi:hypothetical protein